MQTTVARKVAAAPSTGSLLHTLWNRGNMYEKRGVKEQVTTEDLLLSARFLPNLIERLAGMVGYWQDLPLSFLVFFPLSPSLNWGQGPPSWACSIVPQENCQSGLLWLNTESRSFIKKLICYSLPLTHSVFFLPHSSVFHWLTLPHSNFLSWPFSPALFYTAFILYLSAAPHAPSSLLRDYHG